MHSLMAAAATELLPEEGRRVSRLGVAWTVLSLSLKSLSSSKIVGKSDSQETFQQL